MSGRPFSIIDSNVDADRNGILFDPLPAGTYTGVGDNAITVENKGGRNGAYGPNYAQLDARVGYRVRVAQSRTLDLFVEVFNLTDRSNFTNPSGDRRLRISSSSMVSRRRVPAAAAARHAARVLGYRRHVSR